MNRNFDPEAEAAAYIDKWNEKKEWGEVKYFDDLSPETETYLDAFLADYDKEAALLEEKEKKKAIIKTKMEIIGVTKEETLGIPRVKESQNLSIEEKLRKEQKKQMDNIKTVKWLHTLHQIHPTLKKEEAKKMQANKLAIDRGR